MNSGGEDQEVKKVPRDGIYPHLQSEWSFNHRVATTLIYGSMTVLSKALIHPVTGLKDDTMLETQACNMFSTVISRNAQRLKDGWLGTQYKSEYFDFAIGAFLNDVSCFTLDRSC